MNFYQQMNQNKYYKVINKLCYAPEVLNDMQADTRINS